MGAVRQQARDPVETPLMIECVRLWEGLSRELDADIEWVQGGNIALAAAPERLALFERWLGTAQEAGLDTRVLSSREVQALLPGMARTWLGGIDLFSYVAPAAEFVSVRVLGPDNRGKGAAFAAGLEWAIDQGAGVVNLSLSSKSEAMLPVFHELADEAYFHNVLLVSAANNVPGPSYPSLFASVVSVASHDQADPWTYYYNPSPPVEFGAYGLDVDVAWKDGSRIIATGNSFAAPHMAGLATLIRSKHPQVTPFELKAILAATSNGALRASPPAAKRSRRS